MRPWRGLLLLLLWPGLTWGATVGQDDFTAGADTAIASWTPTCGGGSCGNGWTASAAQFTVIAADGNLQHNATSLDLARKEDNLGTDSMTVSASVKTSSAGARRAGIGARLNGSDFTEGYFAEVSGATNMDARLFRRVASSNTQLGSTVTTGTANNTFGTLKLEVSAGSQKVYWNDVLLIETTDSDANLVGNNFAGVWMSGNSLSTVRIDNFVSQTPAAAPSDMFFRRRVGLISPKEWLDEGYRLVRSPM